MYVLTFLLCSHLDTMSKHDNEKGSRSSGSDYDAPLVYERPTGLKGFYYHPITQVQPLSALFLC